MPIVLNGTTGITTPTYNGNTTAEYLVPVTGFKNRIINGDMTIDQRNVGAAATINNTVAYTLDRWEGADNTDGVIQIQQSSTAPTGFTRSLQFTTTTADSSLSATQYAYVAQYIEGLNTADFSFGTASASTVTLSFWVRSSLTGTFGGSISNDSYDRTYPFTYTISAANTWEQKSITLAGDTSGTWLTNNSVGVRVYFCLGAGSSRLGTANAWASSWLLGGTGSTSVVGTLNATWNVTGVQLEKGSVATSFDYLPYSTEMILCQRYYVKSFTYSTVPANGIYSYYSGTFWEGSDNGKNEYVYLPVSMRTSPTFTLYGDSGRWQVFNGGAWVTSTQSIAGAITDRGFTVFIVGNISNSSLHPWYCKGDWVASAEL